MEFIEGFHIVCMDVINLYESLNERGADCLTVFCGTKRLIIYKRIGHTVFIFSGGSFPCSQVLIAKRTIN